MLLADLFFIKGIGIFSACSFTKRRRARNFNKQQIRLQLWYLRTVIEAEGNEKGPKEGGGGAVVEKLQLFL